MNAIKLRLPYGSPKPLKQEYSGSSMAKVQDVYARGYMNIFSVIPRLKSLNLLPRKKVVQE
jgi:hypothetical protein